MRLDLEELEHRPTNKIDGFSTGWKRCFPTCMSTVAAKGIPVVFFKRVTEGTWMGHVIEHIALELQTLAGMDCGFGRTRTTGTEGIYYVVFSYMEDDAGVYAAKAAVKIAQHW